MIKSRIEKIEKNFPINDRPYRKFTDEQISLAIKKLYCSIYKKIKNGSVAQEFKALFIENPTALELIGQDRAGSTEALALFEKQRDWEMRYEEKSDIKDEIFDRYTQLIRSYKFLKSL